MNITNDNQQVNIKFEKLEAKKNKFLNLKKFFRSEKIIKLFFLLMLTGFLINSKIAVIIDGFYYVLNK